MQLLGRGKPLPLDLPLVEQEEQEAGVPVAELGRRSEGELRVF